VRAVVQRVARASVSVDGRLIARIDRGLLALVGVADGDGPGDARWLADKVRTLRVFPDEAGAMNRSVEEAGGAVLVVSQFTLLGDTRRGRRPSFIRAADPEPADELCRAVAEHVRAAGVPVGEGIFGANMQVELVNDGPVTILLDSSKVF